MRPNVLLVVADQHRYDWLAGIDEHIPLRTPHLNQLMGRGVTFRHAVTPSPLCAPARACLATGRCFDRSPVRSNGYDMPVSAPTYYRLLHDSGYHVAGTGKFDLRKKSDDWGLDGRRCMTEWGFSAGLDNEGKMDAVRTGWPRARGPYMAYLHELGLAEAHVRDFQQREAFLSTHPTPLPDHAYEDNWIARNAIAFLRGCPTSRPWHLVVNFAGPHDPMDVTAAMYARWRGTTFPLAVDNDETSAGAQQEVRRNYAAMIENIDDHVGRLLELVAERGESDRTVVVYTSDHGEMLGDHDLWRKSLYYDPSIRIPLVVAGPGVREGIRSDALVSLEDVAATVLDLGGVEVPPQMSALSVLPVLAGERDVHRDFVVSGLESTPGETAKSNAYRHRRGFAYPRAWRLVTDGRYKLVTFADDRPPVAFDLDEDPHELNDIARFRPDLVDRMAVALRAAAC